MDKIKRVYDHHHAEKGGVGNFLGSHPVSVVHVRMYMYSVMSKALMF